MSKNNQASTILDTFVKADILTKSDKKLLVRFMERWELDAFHALLSTHILSEVELADHLAQCLSLERIGQITKEHFDSKGLGLVDYEMARRLSCFPLKISASSERRLRVAIADPTNTSAIEQLARSTQKEIEVCIATESEILNAVCNFYPFAKQFESLL
jgi:hypothetical protein